MQLIELIKSVRLSIQKKLKITDSISIIGMVLQGGLHTNLVLWNITWLCQEFIPS